MDEKMKIKQPRFKLWHLIGLGLVSGIVVLLALSGRSDVITENHMDKNHVQTSSIQSNHINSMMAKSTSMASSKSTHSNPDPAPTQEDWMPKTEADHSLVNMTKGLSQLVNANADVESVKNFLSDHNLGPKESVDSNPDTGILHIIRSENRLPGTRYFHAQIFADEDTQTTIQHISFELQPGEQSFANAVEATKQAFQINHPPENETSEFISWKIENGYEVWIKKLDQEDLKNNPFNGYMAADVGSVRVAVELAIH
jgi:hypothetical protein